MFRSPLGQYQQFLAIVIIPPTLTANARLRGPEVAIHYRGDRTDGQGHQLLILIINKDHWFTLQFFTEMQRDDHKLNHLLPSQPSTSFIL